jgi:hypothetical protein
MFEAIQKETFISTQVSTNSAYQSQPLHPSKSRHVFQRKLFLQVDEQSHFNDRYRPRAN